MRPLATTLPLLAAGSLLLVSCGSGDDGADGARSGGSPDETTSAAPADAPQVPGMIVHASTMDVADTVAAVEDGLSEAGMVAATIDHAAAAEEAGLELDPTVLVIGGNPEAGTPVILAEQEAGIDLPQKYLVWESDDAVWLGYNSADYIAQRAGLDGGDPALDALREGSAGIAAAASGSDEPASTGESSVEDYLETEESDADVATVVGRLEAAFEEGGLGNPATVDHAAGAETVGEDLRPTVVTYGGDPEVGTPLMQQARTIAIDIPLRFVVLEQADGDVEIGYPDYESIAERHSLAADATDTLEMGAEMLAEQAARAGGQSGGARGPDDDASDDRNSNRDGDRDRED